MFRVTITFKLDNKTYVFKTTVSAADCSGAKIIAKVKLCKRHFLPEIVKIDCWAR